MFLQAFAAVWLICSIIAAVAALETHLTLQKPLKSKFDWLDIAAIALIGLFGPFSIGSLFCRICLNTKR